MEPQISNVFSKNFFLEHRGNELVRTFHSEFNSKEWSGPPTKLSCYLEINTHIYSYDEEK